MSAENKLDSYEKEAESAHLAIIWSLTRDFPQSMRNIGDTSNQSVLTINSLLYDEPHDSSTKCYIECLQELVNNPSSYGEANIYEAIETFLSDVELLYSRIREIIELLDNGGIHNFSLEENPKDTAHHLENRLSAIIDRAKLIQFTEREVERLSKSVEKFKNDVSISMESVSKIRDDISQFDEEISDANKDMIAVMGVFTSIIVVIMSVVITSSSWLNNASGASAIIAFIIPSCVAVLAACAIIVFLNIIIQDKKHNYTPLCVVFGITLLIGIVTLWVFGNKEVLPHNRLVFEVDNYATVAPDSVTGERIINIHFTEKIITSDGAHNVEVVIDNQKESDCLIHNDLIYYCITHNRFE